MRAAIVSSTGAPGGTMIQRARGLLLSFPARLGSESAPPAPMDVTCATAPASLSKPTMRCPPRTSRSTMNAPIFPSPTIPSSMPPPRLVFLNAHAACCQIFPQLHRILKMYRAHVHLMCALQIQLPVVNKKAFIGAALRDFERQLVNSFVGLPHTEIAGGEKRLE